ncbi:hypothetical protein DIPPA_07141 [Diplonema papillatum]|nr:hypothetical protein DIPPA_07141 [Diplonema papillatum]
MGLPEPEWYHFVICLGAALGLAACVIFACWRLGQKKLADKELARDNVAKQSKGKTKEALAAERARRDKLVAEKEAELAGRQRPARPKSPDIDVIAPDDDPSAASLVNERAILNKMQDTMSASLKSHRVAARAGLTFPPTTVIHEVHIKRPTPETRLGLELGNTTAVMAVEPNGAAYEGGLREGYVIHAVDGKATRTKAELITEVSSKQGDLVFLVEDVAATEAAEAAERELVVRREALRHITTKDPSPTSLIFIPQADKGSRARSKWYSNDRSSASSPSSTDTSHTSDSDSSSSDDSGTSSTTSSHRRLRALKTKGTGKPGGRRGKKAHGRRHEMRNVAVDHEPRAAPYRPLVDTSMPGSGYHSVRAMQQHPMSAAGHSAVYNSPQHIALYNSPRHSASFTGTQWHAKQSQSPPVITPNMVSSPAPFIPSDGPKRSAKLVVDSSVLGKPRPAPLKKYVAPRRVSRSYES